MTSVVDLGDEKVYTEERRASVVDVHGENIHVSVDKKGTGHAEEGKKEPGPPWRQGLSCCCSGVHFALFNNLSNKFGLLFCSCCAANYQEGWLAYP